MEKATTLIFVDYAPFNIKEFVTKVVSVRTNESESEEITTFDGRSLTIDSFGIKDEAGNLVASFDKIINWNSI